MKAKPAPQAQHKASNNNNKTRNRNGKVAASATRAREQARQESRKGAPFGIMTKVSHANILQNFHFYRQVKRTGATSTNKTLHSVYISSAPTFIYSPSYTVSSLPASSPLLCMWEVRSWVARSLFGYRMWAASAPKLDVGGAKKLLILLAIVSVVIRQAAREVRERGGANDSCSTLCYM